MIHGEINFRSEPDSADVGDDEWGRSRKICERERYFFLLTKMMMIHCISCMLCVTS